MQPKIYIPKDSKQVVQAVKALSVAAGPFKYVRQAHWWISRAYMEGVRNFLDVNYDRGSVQTTYMNESGQLGFRYEEVLTKFRAELGRYLRIDISPLVQAKGRGIDAMRSASVAQVALDYMNSEDTLLQFYVNAAIQFLMYGVIGVGTWIAHGSTDSEGKVLSPRMPRLEVIPPWQLTPIPQDPSSPSDLLGLQRERWVPYEWARSLKDPEGQALVTGHERKKLDVRAVPIGFIPGGSEANYATEDNEPRTNLLASPGAATPEQEFIYLRETWLYDSMGDIGRYIMTGGDAMLYDKDFSEDTDPPPAPIGIASDNFGSFYGRGWIEPLISINSEIEAMLQNLFENVQTLDLYGYVIIPTTTGIKADQIQAGGKPKFLWAEPNYTTVEQKVYSIGPSNTGALPGKVADMGLGLMDRLASQSEMLAGNAPGRIDNSRALDALWEASNVPLGGSVTQLAMAFAQAYRAQLYAAKQIWKKEHTIRITVLDNSLAGIVLDPETQALRLDKNPLPHHRDLQITVKSRYPVSPAQQRAELQQALQIGAMEMWEYRVEVRKRRLDLPVGGEQEWQSYQKAVLENLTLFGDGVTPGQVTVADHDLLPVHMAVLTAFMASPVYSLASDAVRRAFTEHLTEHKVQSGQFPKELPYPEEMEEEGGMAGQEEGMMGGEMAALQQMMQGAGQAGQGMEQAPGVPEPVI